MWAASENHVEIVELFLDNGANANATTEVSHSTLIRLGEFKDTNDPLICFGTEAKSISNSYALYFALSDMSDD